MLLMEIIYCANKIKGDGSGILKHYRKQIKIMQGIFL